MESRDKDRLGDWLDGALRHYSEAEPRAGLESRIFASLAAEQTRLTTRRHWTWLFASLSAIAVTAVIIVAVVVNKPHLRHELVSRTAVRSDVTTAVQDTKSQEPATKVALAIHGHHGGRRSPSMPRKPSAEPMLAQFPSPRPLSEQEQLLEQYVTQFPDQAKLVAQEQEKTEKEMDQLYAENAQRISQQER
jgi:hypothetical protein